MKKTIALVILLIGILTICLPAAWILDTDMTLSLATILCGLVSFFGLYQISLPEPPKNTDISSNSNNSNNSNNSKNSNNYSLTSADKESALRFAIAGAIVIEYLVLVGIVAFFKEGAEKLPVITQTMLSNFTAVVGIVVASYFGSSAYISKKSNKDED